MQQNAILKRLEFHGGLVCLNLGEDFPGFNLVTHVLVPLGYDTLCHGVTELWHAYDFSHESCESVVDEWIVRRHVDVLVKFM